MKIQSFAVFFPFVFAVFGGIPPNPNKFDFHNSHFDPYSLHNNLIFSRERRLPPNSEELMKNLLRKITNRPNDPVVLIKYLKLMNQ